MIGHLRIKSPWSQLGLFLGALGGGLILTWVLSAVLLVSSGTASAALGKPDWSNPALVGTMKWLQAISSITIFLIPALVFALITFNGKPFYFLGLRAVRDRRFYLLGIACVLLAFPLVFWLGELNHGLPVPKWMTDMEEQANVQIQAFLKAGNSLDVLLNVFIIALLPAICEEICFRGALQRIIIHLSRSAWLGIIITSILFSALHFQFLGFLPRMLLGVILGAIYWYSGSLWPSIAAHFVNNAVQVVAASYAPEFAEKNPSMPLFAALLSGLAVWAILWVFRSLSTVSYEKVYEPDALNRSNEFLA